jgi:hypothetical protein
VCRLISLVLGTVALQIDYVSLVGWFLELACGNDLVSLLLRIVFFLHIDDARLVGWVLDLTNGGKGAIGVSVKLLDGSCKSSLISSGGVGIRFGLIVFNGFVSLWLNLV